MQALRHSGHFNVFDIFNLKWEVDFDRLISNVYR